MIKSLVGLTVTIAFLMLLALPASAMNFVVNKSSNTPWVVDLTGNDNQGCTLTMNAGVSHRECPGIRGQGMTQVKAQRYEAIYSHGPGPKTGQPCVWNYAPYVNGNVWTVNITEQSGQYVITLSNENGQIGSACTTR